MPQKLKQDISIGANLQRLRNKMGFSQEEVAIKLQLMNLDTSREIVSRMELGKYNVRVSVLKALKEIYEVDSYDEFFHGI